MALRARAFGRQELEALAEALRIAREMTGQYFALPDDWFARTSHEVCTLRQLRAQEILGAGRLAQIRRLHRVVQPRSPFSGGQGVRAHYRICLQDHNILERLREDTALTARDLLAYVLTHEYVHLIRFDRLEHPYRSFPDDAAREETRVSELAWAIATRLGPPALRRASGTTLG
ncbi:MAG: hypothetical protein HY900_12840 [Deltaproteobacteria bacterium]|nr:hypothetical protein [Deltaproteobacteria bacterium]